MQNIVDKKLKGKMVERERLFGEAALTVAKVQQVWLYSLLFDGVKFISFLFLIWNDCESKSPCALSPSGYYLVKLVTWKQRT